VDPLTAEQVDKIVMNAPEWFQVPLLVAATTGLRQGELAAVRPQDVLLEERRIRVRHTLLTPSCGPLRMGPPKRSYSARDVPILEHVLDRLAGHLACAPRAACDGHTLAFAMPPTRETPDPQPIRRQRFNGTFAMAAKAAGFKATPHDLRHHFASLMIYAGADVVELQALLGHSPRSDEWKRYAHLWPGGLDRARDRLNHFHAERR
jgi:integrase